MVSCFIHIHTFKILGTILQAYNSGLYGKHIVFILPNYFAVDWWKRSSSCNLHVHLMKCYKC